MHIISVLYCPHTCVKGPQISLTTHSRNKHRDRPKEHTNIQFEDAFNNTSMQLMPRTSNNCCLSLLAHHVENRVASIIYDWRKGIRTLSKTYCLAVWLACEVLEYHQHTFLIPLPDYVVLDVCNTIRVLPMEFSRVSDIAEFYGVLLRCYIQD